MLTDKQKENRKKGIGASESGIILGIPSFDDITPYQLWLLKTGRMEKKDLSAIAPVYWGTIHEETIAQEYAKVMNCSVRRISETLFSKKYPYMLCHLDRKIEGQKKGLECKFAMRHSPEWGESGSDVVPLSYIVQVQHQMAVTDYKEQDLAVLIAGWDFRIYHFKRDEQIINKLTTECAKFWGYVNSDVPPPLSNKKDVSLAYPFNNGNLIEADKEVLHALSILTNEKKLIKASEEVKEKAENLVALYIANYDGIMQEGKVIATFRANKNGVRSLRIMGT